MANDTAQDLPNEKSTFESDPVILDSTTDLLDEIIENLPKMYVERKTRPIHAYWDLTFDGISLMISHYTYNLDNHPILDEEFEVRPTHRIGNQITLKEVSTNDVVSTWTLKGDSLIINVLDSGKARPTKYYIYQEEEGSKTFSY